MLKPNLKHKAHQLVYQPGGNAVGMIAGNNLNMNPRRNQKEWYPVFTLTDHRDHNRLILYTLLVSLSYLLRGKRAGMDPRWTEKRVKNSNTTCNSSFMYHIASRCQRMQMKAQFIIRANAKLSLEQADPILGRDKGLSMTRKVRPCCKDRTTTFQQFNTDFPRRSSATTGSTAANGPRKAFDPSRAQDTTLGTEARAWVYLAEPPCTSSSERPNPQSHGLFTSVDRLRYWMNLRRSTWCSSQAENVAPNRGNPATSLLKKLMETAPQTLLFANVRGMWSKWISVNPNAWATLVRMLASLAFNSPVASNEEIRALSPQGIRRTGIQCESTQKAPTSCIPSARCVAAQSVQSNELGSSQAAATIGSIRTILFGGYSSPLKHSASSCSRWNRISSSAITPSWFSKIDKRSRAERTWLRADQSFVGFSITGGMTCSIWLGSSATSSATLHSTRFQSSRLYAPTSKSRLRLTPGRSSPGSLANCTGRISDPTWKTKVPSRHRGLPSGIIGSGPDSLGDKPSASGAGMASTGTPSMTWTTLGLGDLDLDLSGGESSTTRGESSDTSLTRSGSDWRKNIKDPSNRTITWQISVLKQRVTKRDFLFS